jgi:hypothetical protein
MAEKIILEKGNTSTHKLTLSDNEHTKAPKRATIEWKIKEGSNVASIELIKEKSDSTPNIFSTRPYKVNNQKWRAVVAGDAPNHAVWEYFIRWKAVGSNTEHDHDPKISVKPSDLASIIIRFLLALIIGLFTLKFLRKKSKR